MAVQGDHQRGQPGTRHTPQPRAAHLVTPRPVRILGPPPIPQRQLPGPRLDLESRSFRLVEGQHGELAVGIIGAGPAGISPRPAAHPLGSVLGILQPADQRANASSVDHLAGAAKDHRLQGDDVGLLGVDRPQIIQRLANRRIIWRHARFQQSQAAEGRYAPLVPPLPQIDPVPLAALLTSQIANRPLQRLANLGGRHLGPRRGQPAAARRDHHPCHQQPLPRLSHLQFPVSPAACLVHLRVGPGSPQENHNVRCWYCLTWLESKRSAPPPLCVSIALARPP